jgi:hypothetical protein
VCQLAHLVRKAPAGDTQVTTPSRVRWLVGVWADAEQNRTVFLWQKGLIHDSETVDQQGALGLKHATETGACVASSLCLASRLMPSVIAVMSTAFIS